MTEQDGAAKKQRGRGPGSRFKPGQSGNPKGRPKLGQSLAEVVRSKWPPDRIVDAMSKHAESGNEMVAMRAKEWLAERGYGQVPHNVDLDVVGIGPEAQAMLSALAMTPHQRRARREELQLLANGHAAAHANGTNGHSVVAKAHESDVDD